MKLKYKKTKDFFEQYCEDQNVNSTSMALFDGRGSNITHAILENTSYLIFGPEAGFSENELSYFESKTIPLVSLGQRMLRQEHALCAGLQLFQANHLG